MDYVYMDDGEFILVQRSLFHLALADTASFKKMNIVFEWIFWILKKWIIFLNEYSGFKKNEYLFWMNILDF